MSEEKLSWFEKSFAFYLSYHSNHTNQLIHIFCVWPILFTGQIFLTYTNPLIEGDPKTNWSMILSVVYILYYLLVEQPGMAGPIAAGLVYLGWHGANILHNNNQDVWIIAVIVHFLCWAIQIYGHQVYEKRSPAFLDNIVQAFLMAPLFVLMEVLFKFGYKPDFHKKCQAVARKKIIELHNNKNKKST